MRAKLDQYSSAAGMLAELLKRQSLDRSGSILEPFAGSGALSNELRRLGYRVTTNDIDQAYGCDCSLDAVSDRFWENMPRHDWIVTNPPFVHLDYILGKALDHACVGVAMILRLTALEPVTTRGKRGKTLIEYADNQRYLMPFSSPRPSYTGNGKTDQATTAWYVWLKEWSWAGRYAGISSPFQYVTGWAK